MLYTHQVSQYVTGDLFSLSLMTHNVSAISSDFIFQIYSYFSHCSHHRLKPDLFFSLKHNLEVIWTNTLRYKSSRFISHSLGSRSWILQSNVSFHPCYKLLYSSLCNIVLSNGAATPRNILLVSNPFLLSYN